MKLKCDEHQRRVVVVDGLTIHRTGDGSLCKSKVVVFGDKYYRPNSNLNRSIAYGRALDKHRFEGFKLPPINTERLQFAMKGVTEAFDAMAEQLKKIKGPNLPTEFRSSSAYLKSWDNS